MRMVLIRINEKIGFALFVLISLVLFSHLCISAALAASLTVSWNRNQEADTAGYKIYYGTQSHNYSNIITINDSQPEPALCNYTLNGLANSQVYYIALRAFDVGGNESEYSQEVSCTAKPDSDCNSNNLVVNSSIEEGTSEGPSGWHLFDEPQGGEETNPDPGEWSTEESYTGTHSLELHNTTGSHLGWYGEEITFDSPYPRTLIFGGWSKSVNVEPGALYCLDFKITFTDGTVSWLYESLQFDPGSHNWQLKQVTKTWTKDVASVVPYAILYYKTGTVWFDDIFVIPSPDNLIYNASMEEGQDSVCGWHLYDVAKPKRQTNSDPGEWSTEESYTGTHSLKLHNTTGSYLGWYGEEITFDPPYPRTLVFGGWSKSVNVESGTLCCLAFKITFSDGTFTWMNNSLRFDSGTHGWQLRQVTKSWPKDITGVTPYAILYHKSGTVWFDDIFVRQ